MIAGVPPTPVQEEDARFRLLAEQSSDLLSRHSPEGVYRYASPAVHSLLGYTPEELIGRPVFELFHPEELEAAQALHEAIHQTNGVVTLTHRVRGKDGEYVWLECNTRAMRDPHTGEVVEIHAVARDITARREAETRLRESEDRFRTLLGNLDAGVVVHGPTGEIELANQAACTFLGLSEAELLGRRPLPTEWRAVHEDFSPFPLDQQPAAVAARTGRAVRDVVIGVWRPQREDLVWLLANATPRLGDDGELRQVIVCFSDLTARRSAELERERLITDLQDALTRIKTLRGLLPICAGCKKIRDDHGYWKQLEVYLKAHTEAEFSHSLCPECAGRLYPEYLEE
jgi:PAS domain S-box-containing protein